MADNQTRFNQGMDRIMGGIGGKPARQDQRIADDKDIADLPRSIMNYEVPWYGFDGKAPTSGRKTVNLAAFLGWIDSGLNNLSRGLGEIKGSVDALTLAVLELTRKQTGIDQDALNKAMKEATAAALGTYELKKVDE
ncbi:hypothetical protein ACIQXM_02060 [Arthrobacter sp. NPDC097144]|uniref:hypothetical protein n=1 Tax=Arthrobacter sp. NPDC097144 TaxID=3363946 RepID=UPI00381D0CB6